MFRFRAAQTTRAIQVNGESFHQLVAGPYEVLMAQAKVCEDDGDLRRAEALLKEAVDIVDAFGQTALQFVAEFRERIGDALSAERIRRYGVEADGSIAHPWWR
jgi:hypothetical protein